MKFSLSLAAALALGIPAFAQLPPGLAPGGAPANNAAAQQALNGGLQLLNVLGGDIAADYEKYSGLAGEPVKVLVHSSVRDREFTITASGPLTAREAMQWITMSLQMEGVSFVDDGSGIVKMLANAGGTTSPPNEGLPLYTEGDVLPDGDPLIRYAMRFNFLQVDQAQRVFQGVLGASAGQVSMTAVPNAAMIMITGKVPAIRSLIETKEIVDVASVTLVRRWVKVRHADVTELKERLDELFGNASGGGGGSRSGGTTAAVNRGNGLPAGAFPGSGGNNNNNRAAGNAGASAAGESIPMQVIADARTNRLFLQGSPADVLEAKSIIEDFDAPTDASNRLKRKLRYLSVTDFLEVAVNAVAAIEGLQDAPSVGGGGATGSSNRNTNRNSRNTGNTGFNQGGAGGSGSRSSGLNAPETTSRPESVTVGRTNLVADNISNSIIVAGPPQSIEAINTLLDEIDVKPQQVMISAVFGQLGLNDANSTAFNVLKAISEDNPVGGGGGGNNAGGGFDIRSLIGGAAVAPGAAATGDPVGDQLARGVASTARSITGLGLYGQIADFSLYFNALQANNNFKLLARPTVYATNNELAEIQSGTRVAFPSGTSSNSFNGGSFNTNIDYQDVVLRLEVIPLVNSEDEVTLEISLVSDNIGANQTIGTGANAVTVPQIITRELITKVTVQNGGTVALGGLITTREDVTDEGVPVLKNVPLLGRLFKNSEKVKERDELVIFIQPQIISNSFQESQVQLNEANRYKITEAVNDLMGDTGVLPQKPAAGGSTRTARQQSTNEATQPARKERRKNFFKRHYR